ncbi:MAG: hypothetical protein WCA01_12555 [Burkholderiales bacterium]
MKRLLALLAIAALLGGCATYALTGSGPTSPEDKSYSVTLPQNWVRLSSDGKRMIVTRDGFGLQRIMITRTDAKDAFPKIKKQADDKLLASELAELQIAELKSSGAPNLTVMENLPARIGGGIGFRLRIRFLNDDGLAFDQVWCGVLDKGHYYLISFHAPELYYFDKYLPDFDRTLASFKLS